MGVNDQIPPPGLRARVLAAARRRREPEPVVAGWSPIDVHRVEAARALLLLRGLTAADWARPVDPPELAGWTVHDVVVHLMANESLLADELGRPVPGIPETDRDNEGRTAQARARHAGRLPDRAVAELEVASEAVDAAVAARSEDLLDRPIDWWGIRIPTRVALLVRAVETWTHADDIRRAVGLPIVDPPGGSLITMTHLACSLLPTMLAARGADHAGTLVRVRFTDLGDTAWELDLGGPGGVRPAGNDAVDVEIVTQAAAACRVASARIDPRHLRYEVVGDERLARELVDALPALAVV